MSGFLSVLVSYGATITKATLQKIIASDTASQAGANFGSSVAISGDNNYIVIGSYLAGSTDTGAAYVYYNNNGHWEEQAKLVASNAVAGDWFGCAVDITANGDRIIVGAQHANALPYNQDNGGGAYIFQRSGSTWTEEVYISGGNGGTNDYFGNSVAINDTGDVILVGAYGDDDSNSSSVGFIHTYFRTHLANTTTWAGLKWNTDDHELPTTASEGNAYHGWSIACNRDATHCIEGGPGDNNQGKTNSGVVTIHHRASNSTSWTKDIWLEAPYPVNDGQFGWSVAMSGDGDRVVIGEIGGNPQGVVSGAAYVYKLSGTVWSLEQQLYANDKAAGDNFGYSVTINKAGDKIAVGSMKSDLPTKADTGAIYVFDYDGSTWSQTSKLLANDAVSGDNLGNSISINDTGDGVIVGSLNNDPLTSVDSGAAYYFPLVTIKPKLVLTVSTSQTVTLPAGSTKVIIIAAGGGGGGGCANYSNPTTITANGGDGGSANAIVSTHTLPANTTELDIIIGKGGQAITGSTTGSYPKGGTGKYNGGDGGANTGSSNGGAGGGATSVSAGVTVLVVAGGAGGGGGGASSRPGGNGHDAVSISSTIPATNGTSGTTGNAGGGGGGANGGIGGTSGSDNGATAQGGTSGKLSYNASTVVGTPTPKTVANNGTGEKSGHHATAGLDGFVTLTVY